MEKVVFVALIVLLCTWPLAGQHTFSIVAIDTATLEIGSAGATCLDTRREGLGAVVISDILPGRGAIHAQALLNFSNQSNARRRMQAGDSPEEIINWLINNDVQRSPQLRQYGIVSIEAEGEIKAAAFTGRQCLDVKDHILGPNYAIQGNILIGKEVLDSMEHAFLRQEGDLADKLMAAMNAAAFEGADSRCLSEGVSSRSAFLRLARPGDAANQLSIDLVVNETPYGVDPIDELFVAYQQFRFTDTNGVSGPPIQVFPNPFSSSLQLNMPYSSEWIAYFFNTGGEKLYEFRWTGREKTLENLSFKTRGVVLLQLRDVKRPKQFFSQKLLRIEE
jgi:uncharacterized Ntn-hydrolase superfamily protein